MIWIGEIDMNEADLQVVHAGILVQSIIGRYYGVVSGVGDRLLQLSYVYQLWAAKQIDSITRKFIYYLLDEYPIHLCTKLIYAF